MWSFHRSWYHPNPPCGCLTMRFFHFFTFLVTTATLLINFVLLFFDFFVVLYSGTTGTPLMKVTWSGTSGRGPERNLLATMSSSGSGWFVGKLSGPGIFLFFLGRSGTSNPETSWRNRTARTWFPSFGRRGAVRRLISGFEAPTKRVLPCWWGGLSRRTKLIRDY